MKALFNGILSLIFLVGLMFGIKAAIDTAYGVPVADDQVFVSSAAASEPAVVSIAIPTTVATPVVSQLTVSQSPWDCGYFRFDKVPGGRDGYRGYFPEEPLQRVNSKLQIVNEAAKEKNVPFLALLFVWWKEGAKGSGWVVWRASLRNDASNGDGVVGMFDKLSISAQSAYLPGANVDDGMLRTQLSDASIVLQEKARVAAIRYGGEAPLTYQMPADGKATMLAVEGYNKFTFRDKGTSSPYIEGVEGYRTFVRIMTSVWVGCR